MLSMRFGGWRQFRNIRGSARLFATCMVCGDHRREWLVCYPLLSVGWRSKYALDRAVGRGLLEDSYDV